MSDVGPSCSFYCESLNLLLADELLVRHSFSSLTYQLKVAQSSQEGSPPSDSVIEQSVLGGEPADRRSPDARKKCARSAIMWPLYKKKAVMSENVPFDKCAK